jgi:hypothetical protein
MTVYKLGWCGAEVERIQSRLADLGHYSGPVDGIYGGGTEGAVRLFQRAEELAVDGKVGSDTWDRLFRGQQVPEPAIASTPLCQRCLALTGSFETGRMAPDCFAGLSGDFDGQGLNLGVLQWNFGQGSLQPLLVEMNALHQGLLRDMFVHEYDTLVEVLEEGGYEDQMEWARSIQHPVRHYVFEPWRGYFKTLGRTKEFQNIQTRYSENLYRQALDLCQKYGLRSQRAAALMFDIKVQNGGIRKSVREVIEEDIGQLGTDLDKEDLEVEKMVVIANRRAEASNPRWVEDVRSRKLCCAKGQGTVHGISFHLERQFHITLRPYLP